MTTLVKYISLLLMGGLIFFPYPNTGRHKNFNYAAPNSHMIIDRQTNEFSLFNDILIMLIPALKSA